MSDYGFLGQWDGTLPPPLAARAATQGGVFTAGQAVACGFTRPQIQSLVRTRCWHRLRRGHYCLTQTWQESRPVDRLRLFAVAAWLAYDRRPVVSHESAGRLLGLSFLDDLDTGALRVQLTDPGGDHLDTPSLQVFPAALSTGHVIRDTVPPTTAGGRTVVDLARQLPFLAAVVAADSALRLGLTDRAELLAILEQCHSWPGRRAAGAVVAFADGRAQTVGESGMRVHMAAAGLPPPELQVMVQGASGRPYWVDFFFRHHRVIAEFDGRVKYQQRPGQRDPERELWSEKRREDDLRAADYGFLRFTWRDVLAPGPAMAHARSVLERATVA